MKILIAGLGSIGRRHFHNLLALDERDLLLYRTHRSTMPDEELQGFPVEADLGAALAHKPEAVIVSNPTSLHLDVAIPAARAGCCLFLEKPVSHSMERVHDLQAAVEDSRQQAFVGFQFRFHPGLREAKQLLEQGVIGRVLSVHAHWGAYLPGWHPWEDYRQGYSARSELGGGVILTLCHPLDYLRWLLGEVSTLWAFTGHLGELELQVEDTAEIGLRFISGALGSVHLDYNQHPATHRLEIIGSKGTLLWDNADGATRLFRSSSQVWEVFPAPPGFERNDLFLAEMRHFLSVVRREAEPLCTLEDGLRALQLALAAHQSQRSGQMIRF